MIEVILDSYLKSGRSLNKKYFKKLNIFPKVKYFQDYFPDSTTNDGDRRNADFLHKGPLNRGANSVTKVTNIGSRTIISGIENHGLASPATETHRSG